MATFVGVLYLNNFIMNTNDLELVIQLKRKAVAECDYLLSAYLLNVQSEMEYILNDKWTNELLENITKP